MPGQAIITIRDKQWQVDIADTPWELMQGLAGLPGIPPGTGMLFDTGATQLIQVTTVPMLFPIDIAFLSETLVVTEVYHNVEPGYLVTSTVQARYFLEVNAGELEGIDSGDRAFIEFLPAPLMMPAETDWMSAMMSFMGFAIMAVFIVAIARAFVKAAMEPPKEKLVLYGPRGERLLPQVEPVETSVVDATPPEEQPKDEVAKMVRNLVSKEIKKHFKTVQNPRAGVGGSVTHTQGNDVAEIKKLLGRK